MIAQPADGRALGRARVHHLEVARAGVRVVQRGVRRHGLDGTGAHVVVSRKDREALHVGKAFQKLGRRHVHRRAIAQVHVAVVRRDVEAAHELEAPARHVDLSVPERVERHGKLPHALVQRKRALAAKGAQVQAPRAFRVLHVHHHGTVARDDVARRGMGEHLPRHGRPHAAGARHKWHALLAHAVEKGKVAGRNRLVGRKERVIHVREHDGHGRVGTRRGHSPRVAAGTAVRRHPGHGHHPRSAIGTYSCACM